MDAFDFFGKIANNCQDLFLILPETGCLGAVTFASNFFNFSYCPVLSEVGGVGFCTPRFDNGPAK